MAEEGVNPMLDHGEPKQEFLDWAKEHLNENPETVCQLLSEFRDTIYARGGVLPHRTDDEFLRRFLRARYFKLEAAYKLLVRYYNFREDNPTLCKNVDLGNHVQIAQDKIFVVPPYRESSGRRIFNFRAGEWDPNKYSIDELFQLAMCSLELAVSEQQTQILGGICLFDFGGLSLQQILYFTPSTARRVMQMLVTSFPLRIHALHIVNQSYLFDMIYSLFKPFLNAEMKKRIFFHGENFESLHDHIEPKYLPELYGGIQPDYDCDTWIDNLRKDKKMITQMKALGYADSKGEHIHGDIE